MNVSTVVSNVKKMRKGALAQAKFDAEAWTAGLATVIKIWKVVYKQLVDSGIPKIRDEDLLVDDPIVALVLTDIRSAMSTVKRMADKFKKLVAVLKGEQPLEKDLEDLGSALLAARVPEDWEAVLEDQPGPTEWLTVFFKKLIAIKAAQPAVEQGSFLSADISLADMFSPDIFLNAYKLFSAQALGVSVDDLAIHASFEKEAAGAKVPPLKVRGLILQGCSFANKRLDDRESPNKAEYEILPVCHLSFRPRDAQKPPGDLLQVPLFSNLSREKHIADLQLPFSGSKSSLIIKAAALAIAL